MANRRPPKQPAKRVLNPRAPVKKVTPRSRLDTHDDIRRELKKNFKRLAQGHISPSAAQSRSRILHDIMDALPPEGAVDRYTPPEINIFAVASGDYLIPAGPGGSLKIASEDEARAFHGLHGAHQIEPDDVVSFDDEINEADNLVRLPHGSDND